MRFIPSTQIENLKARVGDVAVSTSIHILACVHLIQYPCISTYCIKHVSFFLATQDPLSLSMYPVSVSSLGFHTRGHGPCIAHGTREDLCRCYPVLKHAICLMAPWSPSRAWRGAGPSNCPGGLHRMAGGANRKGGWYPIGSDRIYMVGPDRLGNIYIYTYTYIYIHIHILISDIYTYTYTYKWYIYIYAHINSIYICALYVLPQAPSAAGRRAVWCRNSATPRLAALAPEVTKLWRGGRGWWEPCPH